MNQLKAERNASLILLLPFILVTAVFILYPLVLSAPLTLQQTYGATASRFVGLDNLYSVLKDPDFWKACRNTLIFAAGSIFIQLPIALGLAVLLNSDKVKGRSIYRLIFFSPQMVGVVFAGMIGSLVFAKQTGLLNQLLFKTFGTSPDFPWLDDHILTVLVMLATWLYAGYNMVYFLAGLQSVDKSLLEAGTIDGAGIIDRLIHITIPSIRPVLVFVLLLSFIGSMQLFELPFILLAGPGPDNGGLTIVMYLYQRGFDTGDLGIASTVGWMLSIVVAIAAGVQFYLFRGDANS